MNSSKVITESLSHKSLFSIKLEPADSQDSVENISQQSEAISGISKLLQNVNKCCEDKNGKVLLG